MQGFIKLHRKMLDNPIVCKDSDHLAVWAYILLNATHKEYPSVFQGEKITLQPGQLITGRKVIAEKFKISESKVQRILKLFENEHQIEQQNGNKNRLITVVSWLEYQNSEQQDEQLVNNKRTTTEQQVNTYKNVKNDKNAENVKNQKDIIPHSEIIEYLNLKTGKNFSVSKEAQKHITARWKSGFKLDQFKTVIDKKTAEWLDDPEMDQYLRPQTLFGTKFESYLNQKIVLKGGGNHAQGNGQTGRNGFNRSGQSQSRNPSIPDDELTGLFANYQ